MADYIKYSDFFEPGIDAQFRNFMQSLADIAKQETAKIIAEVQNMSKGITNDITAANIKAQAELTNSISQAKQKIQQNNEVEKEANRLMDEYQRLSAKVASSTSQMARRNEEYKVSLSRANAELKLNARLADAPAGSIQRMRLELQKSVAEWQRMGLIQDYNKKEFEQLTQKIRIQTEQLKKYESAIGDNRRNVGNYKSALSALPGLLTQVTAGFISVYGAYRLGQEIFQTTKTLDVLHQSLKYLIGDTAEVAKSQAFLTGITNDFGLELLSTTQSYIKFRASISGSNFDLKEAEKLFTSVSKAGAVLGLNAQRMELVFLALEQMISKGSVSSEELRRQLGDNLPGAMRIMADALGVTIPKLLQMLKNNELMAQDVLPKFRVQLEKAYGIESVTTISNMQTAVNSLKNEWTQFIDSLQVKEGFQTSLEKISNYLEMWRFIINPKLYATNEGESLAQKQYASIIDNLQGITDKEEVRRKIIEQIQIAYQKQIGYTKQVNELEDKRRKSGEEVQTLAYVKSQQEAYKRIGELLNALIKDRTAFDKLFDKPIKVVESVTDEELNKLKDQLRLATGIIEKLEAQKTINDYLINKSKDVSQITNLEYQNGQLDLMLKYYRGLGSTVDDLANKEQKLFRTFKDNNFIGKLTSPNTETFDAITKQNDARQKKFESDLDRFNKKMGITQEEFYEKDLNLLKYDLENRIITEEEYHRRRVQLWLKYNSDVLNAADQLQSALGGLFDAIYQGLAEEAARELENHNNAIDELKNRLDEEKALKDAGKANDYDRLVAQLGEEQKLRDEAQKKYEVYQKRQAQLKFLETQANLGLSVAEAFAAGAGEGPAGWIIAIAAAASLVAAFLSMQSQIKSIGQYAEGTEYVDGPGTSKSDSIPARLSKGERIVPEEVNRQLDGIDNDKLPEIYKFYKYNMLRGEGAVKGGNELLAELRRSRMVSEKILRRAEQQVNVTVLPDGRLVVLDGSSTKVYTLSK